MPIYSLPYLNTSTVELDPHLFHCMGSVHSEVSLGCQDTCPPTQQRGRGLLRPGSSCMASSGAGGQQQHPSVHIGHSYITCFKSGTVCVLVCVFYLSTYDQFNGNLIYLKKKRNTNSYC